MKRVILAVALIVAFFPLLAGAQAGDAGLRGYVADEQGGVLIGGALVDRPNMPLFPFMAVLIFSAAKPNTLTRGGHAE